MLKLPVLLLFSLLCGTAVQAAAAPVLSALVLPVDGPGLLPTLRNDLEGGVRQALLGERDGGKRAVYGVASVDDTTAVLADAAGAGLACSFEDAACLVRIGVIAGVDEVFAPFALQEGTTLQLRLTRIEVGRRRAVAVAAGVVVHPAVDSGATIARIVDRLLRAPSTLAIEGPAGATVRIAGAVVGNLPLLAPVSVEPGLREVQALAGGRVVASATVSVVGGHQQINLRAPAPAVAPQPVPPEPPSSSPPPLVVAGGSTLGLGALLALGAGVGVVFVESGLSAPQPGSDEGQRNLGMGLIAATVVGAAAAVTGGILLGVGLAP